jgi:hypothetical protein
MLTFYLHVKFLAKLVITVKLLVIHTLIFNQIQRYVQELSCSNFIFPSFSVQIDKFKSILGFELEEV